jgi:hypothetical protein
MKNLLRTLILVLGLVATFYAAAAPLAPLQDGGPIPTCPGGACKPNPN